MEKMSWEKLLSRKRFCVAKNDSSDATNRSVFEADIQRIIFSGAFRRLNKKTQVHPLIANDHVHTRLTHSIEVSQVGKILGKTLGEKISLPNGYTSFDLGSIVEAACLAHDLGNPPFGHAGEEAMKHWFENNESKFFKELSGDQKKDLFNFEGNAQGFRIITQTENYLFHGGMRLTYATLASFMKYPWTSQKGIKKFGAFITEKEILESVANEVGLIKKSDIEWARHPLAYLVEAADDICYGILDLEDAVELKILKLQDVLDIAMNAFSKEEADTIKKELGPEEDFRVYLSRLRGRVFEKAISGAIDGFLKVQDKIMEGRFEGDVFSALDGNDRRKTLIRLAKGLAEKSIYPDAAKVEIELGSYTTFDILLKTFCEAALENCQHIGDPGKNKLGWKSGLVLKMLGNHAPRKGNEPKEKDWDKYQCVRRSIDFISGMTDNYAVYVADQLQGTSQSNKFRY